MARVCIVVVLVSLAVCGTWAEERCAPIAVDSNDYKYVRQTVPGALRVISVIVIQQNSNSACTLGTSFGSIGPDVWVNRGCRAVFQVCYETGYTTVVRCESKDSKTATCNTGGFIRLLTIRTQRSKSSCIEGTSYFKSDTNIIVTKGCRADFLVGF